MAQVVQPQWHRWCSHSGAGGAASGTGGAATVAQVVQPQWHRWCSHSGTGGAASGTGGAATVAQVVMYLLVVQGFGVRALISAAEP